MSSKIKVGIGDRVIVKMKDKEVFIGKISYICETNLQLFDILRHDTGMEIEGTMTFYKNEISQLTRIKESQQNQSDSDTPTRNQINSHQFNIDLQELTRLKNMSQSFKFLDRVDKNYYDALNHLKNCESVGLVGLGFGSSLSTSMPLSLLVLSDLRQVYIFDILVLAKIDDFKPILESEQITKVMHNGSSLYKFFHDKYKIKTLNIFDSQISDWFLSDKLTGQTADSFKDLSECLEFHLNIPKELLSTAVEDFESHKAWSYRPLTNSDKVKAALLVTYLITLRNHLMDVILEDHLKIVKETYSAHKNISDLQKIQNLCTFSVPNKK